jgi:hypothetical protein
MALNATRLANAIKPEIESKVRSYILGGDAASYPNLTEFCRAIAEAVAAAVVSELTTNAVVSVNALTVNPGTFAAGATPVLGQGSGTGSGTVS